MMSFTTLGDLHLGRAVQGFDTTESTRRIMWAFFKWTRRMKATHAVQLGDATDSSRPKTRHLKMLTQWANTFSRDGVTLYILTGNHDVSSQAGTHSALDPLKAAGIKVIDRPCVKPLGAGSPIPARRTHGLFLPFPPPRTYEDGADWLGQVERASERARELMERGERVYLLAHLNVTGARYGEQELVYRAKAFSIPRALLEMPFTDIICGHVHNPQEVGRVWVQGAAQRLRMDERRHDRMMACFSQGGRREANLDALEMVQIKLDATGENYGGAAVTTEMVIEALPIHPGGVMAGCIVKLMPEVDRQTVVAWSAVEEALYREGALHVYPIVPMKKSTREAVERAKKTKGSIPRPAVAGVRFIRSRIGDEAERERIFKMFKGLM
jgi:hypothetical protein